jgi:hypothetical protein
MLIMRFKFAICGLLAASFAAVSLCAAQTPCPGVSGGADYKVLVDEVQFATASGNQPALSLELLQSSVEGALEKVRRVVLARSSSPATILYLPCLGRHPQGPAEFTDAYIRSMTANHAILELWGTLFPLGSGQQEFDIHYVMFPVSSVTAPPPSGIAATEKMMAGKPTAVQVKDYLVDARADLPAYFVVAAGVQAYADRRWDQAAPLLCEARTRLRNKPGQPDLMKLADQLASKAARELRNSSDPAGTSLMTDAQAQDYCTFAMTR